MLLAKLTLTAGMVALLSLTRISTWTATLESVAGSGITGTALVDTPDGSPSMSTSDSVGRFDSMPVFQSDSARAQNPTQLTSPGAPRATRASISISGAKPGEYPWQIVPGRCGVTNQASATGRQLPVIRVVSDGKGTAEGYLAMPFGVGAEYSVVVLQSRTDNSVVSCGVLQSGGGLT